jgi:hypothetical protein
MREQRFARLFFHWDCAGRSKGAQRLLLTFPPTGFQAIIKHADLHINKRKHFLPIH